MLLPFLPPRRQSCRRNVCRVAVRRDYFILLPFRPTRKLRRAALEVTITGRQAAAKDPLNSAPRCFPSRKKGKAQLSRAKTALRGAKWRASLRILLEPGLVIQWTRRPPRRATTGSPTPESGCAVSKVVENLSRKIHTGTAKYYGERVESVYP